MAIKFNFQYADETHLMNNPVIVMQFNRINQSEYGQILFRPAYMKWHNGKDCQQWTFEYYGDHTGEHVLYFLMLEATFKWTNKAELRYTFGEIFGYNDDKAFSALNIDRTQEKMRFLNRLANAMSKIENVRGKAMSFGEQAQRFGEVLGVEDFLLDTTVGYSYLKTYRVIRIGDIQRIVNDAIETNKVGF